MGFAQNISSLLASASEAHAVFRARQEAPRSAFFVPGRIEFLGKHTDYAGGRSLLCTVERGFVLVASPRVDRMIQVVTPGNGSPTCFPLDADLIPSDNHWSNYAMTVARRIARNFAGPLRGADIAFASDLPPSAGLSSSSALVVAFFLALAKINQLSDRPEYQRNIPGLIDLAAYLGTIENGQTFGTLTGDRGVGTFGGSEDHTAILCAKPHTLRQFAFCPVRHERDVALPEGFLLAVASSGVVAEKTGAARDAYNALSLSVQSIMCRWREQNRISNGTLASVVANPETLAKLRRMLCDDAGAQLLVDRLEQFVLENNQIIPAASDALAEGRAQDLGRLVARSQDLAERLLKNQVPETIFLARSAQECGAVAASAFGAGFGGSVWALASASGIDGFMANWRKRYLSRFPQRASASSFFVTSGGPPAHEVSLTSPD